MTLKLFKRVILGVCRLHAKYLRDTLKNGGVGWCQTCPFFIEKQRNKKLKSHSKSDRLVFVILMFMYAFIIRGG